MKIWLKHLICLMLILVITITGTMSVLADNSTITVSTVVNNETAQVKISGIVSPANRQKITYMVLKPNANPYSLSDITELNVESIVSGGNQTISNIDGSYEFLYVLGNSAPGGWYKAIVGGTGIKGAENLRSTTFYYANSNERTLAITAINDADKTNMDAQLQKYTVQNPVLGLNLTGEYLDVKDGVCEALIAIKLETANKRFNSILEIQQAFNKAIALSQLNVAINAETNVGTILTIENVLHRYSADLELTLSSDYAVNKSAIHTALLNLRLASPEKKFVNISNVKNAFNHAVVIGAVNMSNRENMGQTIYNYNNILQLDLTGPYVSMDKIEVHKALTNKNFKSIAEIQKAFNDRIVDMQHAMQQTTSNSGSSSSSGGRNDVVVTIPRVDEVPPASHTQKYIDLNDVPWALESINQLVEKGVLTIPNDLRYNPAQQVTREEFVKMLIIACGLEDKNAKCDFNDVENDAWYAPYIGSAQNLKIVQGSDGYLFGVGKYITREDMAVLACRTITVANKSLNQNEFAVSFVDEENVASYAIECVKVMQKANVINGTGNDKFEPKSNSTRAQAAKVIYELLKSMK